jgi:ribosomal protein S18 acetylase RimI-like enzyme
MILTDFSPSAVLPACRNNLYQYLANLRNWKRTEFTETSSLWRWRTPLAHPWFSGVLSLQPPAPDETETIHKTIAYFKANGVRVFIFTWWLSPGAEEWGRQLETGGFKFNNDPPGMVVELAQLNESIRTPDGLKITRVETAEVMETWAHVFTQGYGLPLEWESDVLDSMVATSLDGPQSAYLAIVDEAPASAAALFLGAGVAGIYNVGTLPEWRGKGIGAAITLQPLVEARSQGYRIGSLQSSEMGYKVYERLGFREMFKASHYHFESR